MHGGFGVFLGLDVGKDGHHAVGVAPDGKRLHKAALPNTEAKLRGLFDKLGRHGTVLVVVDQPASIGALPVAVARACGHQVAYLPGLAMRRIADPHPGTAKTDAGDAYVIADAARTLPHTLRFRSEQTRSPRRGSRSTRPRWARDEQQTRRRLAALGVVEALAKKVSGNFWTIVRVLLTPKEWSLTIKVSGFGLGEASAQVTFGA